LAYTQAQSNGDAIFTIPDHEPIDSGGGSLDLPIDELSDTDRQTIQTEIQANFARLTVDGAFALEQATAVSLSWPLSSANGLDDYGYQGISNFVDQDSRHGFLLDYNCGDRTYDLSGYNHQGTDFFSWPFAWNKMDNDEVIIIAAAPGTIVYKEDGNYDRSCSIGGGRWNAVYVRHSDGSIAWYGHLKSGSLTSKGIGETIDTGEYLGVMGSSGSSTGPHLHFELYSDVTQTNLVDPYEGSCNQMNANSWWALQRPYYDTAVNKLMTGSAPVDWADCPNPSTTNEQTEFSGGDVVYFTTFYRDQLAGQTSQYTIYEPENTIFQRWTASSSTDHYAASWWWWSYSLPTDAAGGVWRFEVLFEGQTYETTFTVNNYIDITAPIDSAFWQPGADMTITWQDNLSGNVKIDLLKNGLLSSTITATTPSDGSHIWTIPLNSAIGLGYQIRVADVGDTAVADTSPSFAIGRREQFHNIFLPVTLK
jgi:hypothetical protein